VRSGEVESAAGEVESSDGVAPRRAWWHCSPRGDVAALAATLQPSWRRCSPRGDVAALVATLQPFRRNRGGRESRHCGIATLLHRRSGIATLPPARERRRQTPHLDRGMRPCSVAAVVGVAASRQSLALQRRGSRWRCGIVAMRPRGIVGDAAAPAVGCRRAASWSCRGGLGGWSPRSTTSKCWAICSWRR
jgi:hypothetical protein